MRQNSLMWRAFVGAALAASGVWAADAPVNSAMDRPTMTPAAALPPGFTSTDAKAADDIRQSVGSVVNDAMTKGDFRAVLRDFAGTGAHRTGADIADADLTKLDGRLDEIHKAFNAKYGRDFEITRDLSRSIFANWAVAQGQVTDPATALANWPLNAGSPEAMKAAAVQPADPPVDPNAQRNAENNAELTKGRDVALLQIAESGKCPAVTVSLINQFPDRWLVDVPTDRTAQEIYNDLLTHLTYVGDHSEQWPTDVNEAYQMISHHVLLAIYGVETPMK